MKYILISIIIFLIIYKVIKKWLDNTDYKLFKKEKEYINRSHRWLIIPLLISICYAQVGKVTVNSPLYVVTTADTTSSFVSLENHIPYYWPETDKLLATSYVPNTWRNGKNIPGLRIRHPGNVVGNPNNTTSVQKDFTIHPYQYGMVMEFNGVFEAWVGEFSVHRGYFYADVEGHGNGWGGVLWVGDDGDRGGIRMTARNNIPFGGNVKYGEMAVEDFFRTSGGDLRLRLPDTKDKFQWVYGGHGSTNVIAELSTKGLQLPHSDTLAPATRGTLMYDTTDNTPKFYNGTLWKRLGQ